MVNVKGMIEAVPIHSAAQIDKYVEKSSSMRVTQQ